MTARNHRPALLALLILSGACSASTATSAANPAEPAVPATPETEVAAETQVAAAATFYTAEQAARGLQTFRRVCAECHNRSDFRGRQFELDWRRLTARNLFRTMVESMPEDNPGGLVDEAYVDVIAYILELNGFPPGDTELLPTDESLERVPLGPGG
jgi:mono/diheme cytochrome c family protein